MVHFEGVEKFGEAVPHVYTRLADAGWLARSLPENDVIDASADKASWRVKPKLAFMAGVLETNAEVNERVEIEKVRYTIISKGVGSSSTVVATLLMSSVEGGTEVAWSADLTELGGLLKLVPRGLLQAAAQKVIVEAWATIKLKMAEA